MNDALRCSPPVDTTGIRQKDLGMHRRANRIDLVIEINGPKTVPYN
jgi:hypothetical protein